MRRLAIVTAVAGLGLAAAAEPDGRAGMAPLKPTGFTAQAIVLSPRKIGDRIIRARSAIAVQIRVILEDYQPRGMEPTLVIDGEPLKLDSGVISVDGRTTILGFVVERPDVLAEGATLALQMGEDEARRVPIPGELRRGQIKPLDADAASKAGVPSLTEWLGPAKPPRQ